MLAFLEMNGIYISTDDDVIDIGIKVASGKANYEDVLSWIKSFEKIINVLAEICKVLVFVTK